MTLTATRTTPGFELLHNLMGFAPNPTLYPLTPNTAFTQGDMVVLTNGLVAKAAAGATNVLGVMAETITTTDNPSGNRKLATVHDNPFNVYRCSFSGHRDATATGGTTTTLVDTTLATSTDGVWTGALLYIYDGPNAGEWRIVAGYTGATDTLTVTKPFPTAITNASKYILLGNGSAAGDVISTGTVGVDLVDENTIAAGATVASEAGPLVVLSIDPANLTMDVLIRKHRYNR
jgi:hypothetical protein